jgi:hypothetical protein
VRLLIEAAAGKPETEAGTLFRPQPVVGEVSHDGRLLAVGQAVPSAAFCTGKKIPGIKALVQQALVGQASVAGRFIGPGCTSVVSLKIAETTKRWSRLSSPWQPVVGVSGASTSMLAVS